MDSSEEQQPVVHKRYARNFLLKPTLQIKLGIVSVIVAMFFCTLIVGMVYINLSNFYRLVLDLTGLQKEVTEILDLYITSIAWWILSLTVIYLLVTIFLSIYYTHRLIGPTVAFRRHIRALQEGRYESRVVLRKHDAFAEVAEDLNQLAETLQKSKT